MKNTLLGLTAAFMLPMSVSAATHTFDIWDHNGGLHSATYDYGIRADGINSFFSLNAGNGTTMVYDDVAGTVNVQGTVRQDFGDGTFGDLTNWQYTFPSVENTGFASWQDTSGTGYGLIGDADDPNAIVMGAVARPDGLYAFFGVGAWRPNLHEGYTGAWWFSKDRGRLGNANDVGISATPSAVPVPAAGLLLLTAIGGIFASRRKTS